MYQVHPAFLVLRKTSVTVCPGTRNAVRQGKDAAKLEHSGDAVLATDVMGSEVSDSNRENLTDAQKNYLTEVFQEREHTSKKADPSIISKAMRRAKLSNGSNIFQKDDFFTADSRIIFFAQQRKI
ncbi:unnamed protein product [Pocillopora meandrina]|uniref:Uncharacterized protein n=1 Tax=Pocillopora meandrina TaxID=46732 RepID=A0AAU9X894_9CNID|nr:unnamed protein product [Pocillopora meandrina]